jgi:hypothetical protein
VLDEWEADLSAVPDGLDEMGGAAVRWLAGMSKVMRLSLIIIVVSVIVGLVVAHQVVCKAVNER